MRLQGLALRRLELHRHCGETAKAHASTASGFAVQAIRRKTLHEAADGDTRLESRERQPGALMDTEAKREMPVRIAADIEAVRIRELLRIAIGRADTQCDGRAGSGQGGLCAA